MRNTLLFLKQTSSIVPSRYRAGAADRLKHSQGGMTLVEVLVAMFVLAVGVLALLATQLRTVSSVREAESQTIVAQAVQNLIEGMQLNPTLSAATGANAEETGWVNKNYDAYLTLTPKIKKHTVNQSALFTKSVPVAEQLNRFENSLSAALPNASVHYVICRGTTDMEIDAANSIQGNCDTGNTAPLVVKVLWQIDNEKQAEGALKSKGSKLVYTYQARIPD